MSAVPPFVSKTASSGADTLVDEPLSMSGSPTTPLTPGQVDEMNNFVPPHNSARTLVLCFDGTGDQFDSDVSVICVSRLMKLPSHVPRQPEL